MKKFLLAFVTSLLLGVIGFVALKNALDMPTVYKSYSDKQCQKVVRFDGTPGSCSQLPTKYHLIWVE